MKSRNAHSCLGEIRIREVERGKKMGCAPATNATESRERTTCIRSNVGGPRVPYAKRGESDRDMGSLHGVTYLWHLKKKNIKPTESSVVLT